MTIKHRMTRTPTYTSWRKMRERCHNPRATQWAWYGARGITVCERWRHSFENFLADMGARPMGMTLDRIDPNGNYEPSNCRWELLKRQQRNQRKTIKLGCESLRDVCEEKGVSFDAAYQRLRRGITDADVLLSRAHLRERKTYAAVAEYATLRRSGLSNKQISERFAMTEASIEKWAKTARERGLLS